MAFSLFRSRATQVLGVATALVLMLVPSTTLAQDPGEGGGPTTSAVAATQVNTLAPIADLLSGPAVDDRDQPGPDLPEEPGRRAVRGRRRSEQRRHASQPGRRRARALPRPGAGVQHQPPRHPRLQLAARTRPSPASPSTPTDPEHLVLGTIDYNFPSMSSYVTIDGGESWDGPFQSPYLLDDQFSGGDPSLAFDRAGQRLHDQHLHRRGGLHRRARRGHPRGVQHRRGTLR